MSSIGCVPPIWDPMGPHGVRDIFVKVLQGYLGLVGLAFYRVRVRVLSSARKACVVDLSELACSRH